MIFQLLRRNLQFVISIEQETMLVVVMCAIWFNILYTTSGWEIVVNKIGHESKPP